MKTLILGLGLLLGQGTPTRNPENGAMLVLTEDTPPGVLRLSRYELDRKAFATVWKRPLLPMGVHLLDVSKQDRKGRAFMLLRRAGRTEVATLAVDSGRIVRTRTVAPETSAVGLLGGRPVLFGYDGATLLSAPRPSNWLQTDGWGDMASVLVTNGKPPTAYFLDTTPEHGGASGCLGACRLRNGRLETTYRRDLAPGPYAFAQSGSRLIVLLSGGPLQVYNVASPAHPRLAGSFYRNNGWEALGTDAATGRIYGLRITGELQAFRFDDRRGMVAVTNRAAGRPISYPASLLVGRRFVTVCRADGTVQVYRTTGSTLEPLGDYTLGKGQTWIVR